MSVLSVHSTSQAPHWVTAATCVLSKIALLLLFLGWGLYQVFFTWKLLPWP
jgi:hypothetical protein